MGWNDILEDFVTMWVIIDPVGTIPIFLAATAQVPAEQRGAIAIKAILFSFGVLTFFIVLGQVLLEAMGISLISFQIAGSIVLFLFSLTMIFGGSLAGSKVEDDPSEDQNIAIYPLAVPAIAGPGAMLAVVVLTDNHRFQIAEQAVTTLTVGVVLGLTLALLLLANPIQKAIGPGGASIVSRVMGLVLAAVAVDNILDGIEQRFFGG